MLLSRVPLRAHRPWQDSPASRAPRPAHETRPRLPDGPKPPKPLSTRERQVYALLAAGATDGEICRELHVQRQTVKNHILRIREVIGPYNRTELSVLWHGGIPYSQTQQGTRARREARGDEAMKSQEVADGVERDGGS
jgi:DNA-binding CsgD family transcriptional regulator